MNNYELLIEINKKTLGNINQLSKSGKIKKLSKCISFTDDMQNWLSYCESYGCYELVKEAQSECVNSIFMCAQGLYKSAIATLRQCLEHFLFFILLSTNDYSYRLWKAGQKDMSWNQLIDEQNGVFGKSFIRMYACDVDENRSIELITISKDVYRECSEFVHGNYEKLNLLSENIDYNEDAYECYINYFSSIQYIISMALFIRFREILNDRDTLISLEPIINDNIGSLQEVQLLLCREGDNE